MTDTITISKKVYDSLVRDAKELTALHVGGVDNWEWYYQSLQDAGLLDEEDDEEDKDA